jgi:hypothetical protein
MAITATFELTAMQWDVTNAFCQAELDESNAHLVMVGPAFAYDC